MNITIKATNHPLTDELRVLIATKFAALDKFVRDGQPALLECEVQESLEAVRSGHGPYRVEGNLTINGKLFRAEAEGEALEGAIDRVRDELSREVRTAHGKARDLVRRGGAAVKGWLRFGRRT